MSKHSGHSSDPVNVGSSDDAINFLLNYASAKIKPDLLHNLVAKKSRDENIEFRNAVTEGSFDDSQSARLSLLSFGYFLDIIETAARRMGVGTVGAIAPDPKDLSLVARVHLHMLPESPAVTEGHSPDSDDPAIITSLWDDFRDITEKEALWLVSVPEGEIRDAVNSLIRDAVRANLATATEKSAWRLMSSEGQSDQIRRAKSFLHAPDLRAMLILGSNQDDRSAWLRSGRVLSKLTMSSVSRGIALSSLDQTILTRPLRVRLSLITGQFGYPQVVFKVA